MGVPELGAAVPRQHGVQPRRRGETQRRHSGRPRGDIRGLLSRISPRLRVYSLVKMSKGEKRGSSPHPRRRKASNESGAAATSKAPSRENGSGASDAAKLHGDIKPSPEDLYVPPIAWPTVILCLVASIGWYGTLAADLLGALPEGWPRWATLMTQAVLAYVLFTPLHDAVHGSVFSHKSGMRWGNVVVGHLSAGPVAGPPIYYAFRFVHLRHHRHTNDPELDPDYYAGAGHWALMPLRWMTQDLYYYPYYLSRLNTRSISEIVTSVGSLLAAYGFMGWLAWSGYSEQLLWSWLLPSRIATTWLAFAFDYLPHRGKERDKYKATTVLSLSGEDKVAPLTVPLLSQNMHNIHHLWAHLPFYRYGELWGKYQNDLQERGTLIRPLLPIFLPLG